MFDVIWTDHNRELVGERRARKELDKDPKKRDDARSNRSSMSTASSASSRNEKSLGFFGAIGRIKSGQSSKSRSLATSHSYDGTSGISAESYPIPLTPASTCPDDKQSINETVESRSNLEQSRESYDNTTDRSSQGGTWLFSSDVVSFVLFR
jgi:hypothetical protein